MRLIATVLIIVVSFFLLILYPPLGALGMVLGAAVYILGRKK
jgi:hypothetical protein